MTAHIALICPTRQRPVQFKRMVDSAMRTAHDPDNIHVYFYMAESDPTKDYYPNLNCATRFLGFDWSAVMASNYLASKAEADLYFMCADDCVFSTPHWDKALREAYNGQPHVYSLLDSRDAEGTPHPIVTKEYIKTMGWFMPPIFLHWFADGWVVDIAKANGCFTHLKDYLLIHEKPSDHGHPDETHTRIRQLGWHERDKFVSETCRDWLELQNHKLKSRIANNGKTCAEILNEKYLLDNEEAA